MASSTGPAYEKTILDQPHLREAPEEKMMDHPPIHPMPVMQGAFEESMIETTNDMGAESAKVFSEKIDSATRRRILLEQEVHEETHAARWRQKPGERFHPLWKILSQISFGVHLLQNGMAKSEDEVVKILQTHVDEVDGFLERTTDDFDLAINDIKERLDFLKLPLQHGELFDTMLADRDYRTQIVDGNEKIEHIINRTDAAMKDALRDIKQALEATKELAIYIISLDSAWPDRTGRLDSVYTAMKGNSDGWYRAFVSLQSKGDRLNLLLTELGSVVAEIQKRAGIVSRKMIPSLVPPPRSSGSKSSTRSNVTTNSQAYAQRHASSRSNQSGRTQSTRTGQSQLYPHDRVMANSPTSSVSSLRQASNRSTRLGVENGDMRGLSPVSPLMSPNRSPRKSPLNPDNEFRHHDSAYISGNSTTYSDNQSNRDSHPQNQPQLVPPSTSFHNPPPSSPNPPSSNGTDTTRKPPMRRGNSRLDSYHVTPKASISSMQTSSIASSPTVNGEKAGRRRASFNFIKNAFHRKKPSKLDSASVTEHVLPERAHTSPQMKT